MTILHIIGKPRQGKGILMTFLACYVAEAGTPVDSNYHIQSMNPADNRICDCISCQQKPMNERKMIGKNHRCIDFYELLAFLKKPRQSPPHLLNIDELPGWCDSYAPTGKSSRFATHFLNQSAKLGYDTEFSSQRSMRADINFRELRQAACKAEKTENENGLLFKYRWLDPDETEEDVETGKTTNIPCSLAKSFWNLYDTYEAVEPVGLDEVLSEMQKHDPVRFRAELDRQVNMLLPIWETGEAVNRLSVSSALLDCGLPIVHAQLVAYRLAKRFRRRTEPQSRTQTPTLTEQPLQLQCLDRWKQLRNQSSK